MLYPINVSMGNTLSLLQRIIFDSVPSSTVLNLLSLILLVSIALKTYFAPSKPNIQIISLLALAVILFPQVSFSYYLILLLPALLIAISTHIDLNRMQKVRSLSTLESQAEHLFESKWIRYFLLLYLLPIQIPLSLFMDVTDISTNLAISFHWIFLQVGLIALTIYLLGWKREHKV